MFLYSASSSKGSAAVTLLFCLMILLAPGSSVASMAKRRHRPHDALGGGNFRPATESTDLIRSTMRGRRIYFMPSIWEDFTRNSCCLNNKLLILLARVQRLCTACRPGAGGVALIPDEIEKHGMYGLYNSTAIEALKAEGIAHKCTCAFVTSEEAETHEKAGGTRKKVPRPSMRDATLGGPFNCWMYSNLQIPPDLKPGFPTFVAEIADAFDRSLEPGLLERDPLLALRSLDYTAAHLRIEKDWMFLRCTNPNRKHKDSTMKWCFNSTEVAEAVRGDVQMASDRNFVLVHGKSLLEEDMGSGHPTEVWKRVIPGSKTFDRTNYNKATSGRKTFIQTGGIKGMIIDLLVSLQASRFVGHFMSSFAIGVMQGQVCKQRVSEASNVNEAQALSRAVAYSCPMADEIAKLNVRSIGNCDGVERFGWGSKNYKIVKQVQAEL